MQGPATQGRFFLVDPGVIVVMLALVQDKPAMTNEEVVARYFTASSSTSNISVAFGGITPPAPRAP